MAIEVTAQDAPCGAHIRGVDLSRALTAQEVAEIRAIWLQYQVVAFPDQPLQIEDIERFSSYVGPDGIGEHRGYPTLVGRSAEASDVEMAKRLWTLSEELTGVKFPLTAVR